MPRLLRKKRLLHEYPPLAERAGTRISQHEHTIIISESGAKVGAERSARVRVGALIQQLAHELYMPFS